MKTISLQPWDAADYLDSREAMVSYLNACISDDPGDGSLIRTALSDIARAQNMSHLAEKAGLTRAGLYKALAPEGRPGFDTLLRITRALDIDLRFDQRPQP